MTRHNRLVLRGALLVVVFVASLWAIAARAMPAPRDASVMLAGAGACSQMDGPMSSGDSDNQRIARHHAHASVTESVWKSSHVHAGLAGTRCPELFVAMRVPRPVDHRGPPTARLPLHIPLLI